MSNKSEMIILPTETFSSTSASTNSFVKEEKFTRLKSNTPSHKSNTKPQCKRIEKKNSHLSTKEVSPSKFREKFLEKMAEYEKKKYNEDSDKKRNLKKTNTVSYISESCTILNKEHSYYDLSDISSLNLNSSKEESSDDDEDNDCALVFNIEK